jgi:hypothetical protein
MSATVELLHSIVANGVCTVIAAAGVTQELRDGGYFDRTLHLEDIVQA